MPVNRTNSDVGVRVLSPPYWFSCFTYGQPSRKGWSHSDPFVSTGTSGALPIGVRHPSSRTIRVHESEGEGEGGLSWDRPHRGSGGLTGEGDLVENQTSSRDSPPSFEILGHWVGRRGTSTVRVRVTDSVTN